MDGDDGDDGDDDGDSDGDDDGDDGDHIAARWYDCGRWGGCQLVITVITSASVIAIVNCGIMLNNCTTGVPCGL